MRKFLVSIATVMMALIMSLSTLTGCNLIVTNLDRDMNQVVATVQIDKSAPLEKIYKKDMIMAYLNYGYINEQYYGQTRKQVFQAIIDELVENRVYVQNAIYTLKQDSANVLNPSVADEWDASRYLNAKDCIDAQYQAYKTMNDLIDSYETKDEGEKFSETLTEEVRAVPTGASIKEEEIDKEQYIQDGIDSGTDDPKRKEAYNKVIKLLKNNGLLGEYKNDIKQTDYYKQTLKNNYELLLLNNFKNKLADEVREQYVLNSAYDSNVSNSTKYILDKLSAQYLKEIEKQTELSNKDFEEKLSSATAGAPMLVGQNGTYGYVYNLLLGASEIQSEKINAITTTDKTERAEERKAILEATTVKDLRSTWVLSGYDFEILNPNDQSLEKDIKFINDYAFLEDSIPFKGKVRLTQEAEGEEKAKYKVSMLDEFTLAEFILFMEEYVYGQNIPVLKDVSANPSYYRWAESDGANLDDYEKRINELLFAFSTDAGSLNTFKGYAVKPIPDGADKEQYMQEFADGARDLLKAEKKNSYLVVATDYGYHVMFYSELLKVDPTYATLDKYLESLYGTQTWSDMIEDILSKWNDEKAIKEYKNNYLYLLLDSISSAEISAKIEEYENKTKYDYIKSSNDYVKKYQSRYSDLWK